MYDDLSALALRPAETAFFFDFDGTLAEIVDDPSAVTVAPDVLLAIAALHEASDGAVAVVSGREMAALDVFLAPLRLPLGGAHGAERRDAGGQVHRVDADGSAIEQVADALERVARVNDGLLVERKRSSVALHYRRRPDLEAMCRTASRDLASRCGLAMLEGKMVVELKLSGRTKGDLIGDFMSEKPFLGRRPIFVGDDVTDEDAFRVLPRWDGIGVKVGTGPTAASHRIPDPAALHAWLLRLTGAPERNGASRVSPAAPTSQERVDNLRSTEE
ncbi:MAG: trehalose-phosphatase [Dechloromonas sp.]|nr:trehalose-phosphatase [Dechloromonas sp.]